MKIGVNSRIYQGRATGIPNYLKGLYGALLKLDQENEYVFFQTNKSKKLGRTLTGKTWKGDLGALWFDNFKVNKLAQKEKIDIFHGASFILPRRPLTGVKHVLTVYDLSFLLFPQNVGPLFHYYYRLAVKRSVQAADVIVAISQSTRRDIIHYYAVAPEKIKVVYPGVNEFFSELPAASRRPGQNYYFCTITTHARRKNIVNIIKAMADSRILRSLKLVIIGAIRPAPLKGLRQLINDNRLNRQVIFTGYVSEEKLRRLYQAAAFFVYPSFYEGFGLPVAEAMACGCPVITADNSSLPEVNPNQEWQVKAKDTTGLRQKMETLWRLPAAERAALIENNIRFVRQFSWAKAAAAMQAIFNN